MANPAAVSVTPDWQLVVAAGAEFLITSRTLVPVEIGAFDGSAPTAGSVGHWLDARRGEGVIRSVLGPGAVYVRGPEEATIVVKTWTA